MNTIVQEIINGNIPDRKTDGNMTNENNQQIKSYKKMSDEEWMEELKKTILLQIKDNKFNMDLLGKGMKISRRQLQRKIKKITGCSPKVYIKELRLIESLRLLETGEVHSVKELASRIGFISAEYFSTQFKNRFGKVPSSFLKRKGVPIQYK